MIARTGAGVSLVAAALLLAACSKSPQKMAVGFSHPLVEMSLRSLLSQQTAAVAGQ